MDIYFDNAATTRPYDEVVDCYCDWLKNEYANPSSLHAAGVSASAALPYASEWVQKVLGLHDRRVVFTSGATESTNMAIRGTIEKLTDITKAGIVTTTYEHPCVGNVAAYYASRGVAVSYVGCDECGRINLNALSEAVRAETKIVSVIWVNNEFGAIADISAIAKIIKAKNPYTLLHADATQGFGRVSGDLSAADMISISGHKFHAPKGIGALIMKKEVTLAPLLLGGGQQDGFRSGTINAPLIYALGRAAKIIGESGAEEKTRAVQEYLYSRVSETFGEDVINNKIHSAPFAPHIISLSFEGLRGEHILHMLEEKHIYVSTASACSSHDKAHRSVLSEIGIPASRSSGTIRVSLCEANTTEEVDIFIDALNEIINRLKKLRRK